MAMVTICDIVISSMRQATFLIKVHDTPKNLNDLKCLTDNIYIIFIYVCREMILIVHGFPSDIIALQVSKTGPKTKKKNKMSCFFFKLWIA